MQNHWTKKKKEFLKVEILHDLKVLSLSLPNLHP